MAEQPSIKHEERSTPQGEQTRPGRSYLPNVDIRETESSLWLWADVPGVDESSLEVNLDDGQLRISGRVAVESYAALSPLYTEYNVGHFARSFRIDSAIDSERITARLADGVLELELPKAQAARPRRIAVNSAA